MKDRLEEALSIDISSYLSSQGIKPVRENSRFSYYLSPLPGRNDSSPSFVVDKNRNRWVDYGISPNADRIISLVCQMENCDFGRAIDTLLGEEKSKFKKLQEEIKKSFKKSVQVVSVKNWFTEELVTYVYERKLNLKLIKKYCKQVVVSFPNSKQPDRQYTFIGFKNNLGGYELRSPKMKISTSPKYYTTIGTGKTRFFFEGFMDYLSFLVMAGKDKLNGRAFIMNSLTLLPWVYDIMKTDGLNHLYFDNDRTASKHISKLDEEGISYIDHRKYYKMYNDLNNKLCDKISL